MACRAVRRNRRVMLFILLIACGNLWAADEFQGIKCGANIPKALIGKHASNEAVAVIEGRHKDLGLKNLGGSEVSDRLFLASWQLCGSEYEVLLNTKTNVVQDAIAFPAHSAAAPMFIGKCQVSKKDFPGTIVAVLNNSAKFNARDEKLAKTLLKASAAWSIDEKKQKSVKQPTEKLMCPLDGIVTQDGGP